MLKEVILPWESSDVMFACNDRVAMGLWSVDLVVISIQIAFVAKAGVFAI
jgi:hypothetical protein